MAGLFRRFRQGSVTLAPPVERDERQPSAADIQASVPLEATPKTYWGRRIPVIACGAGLFADGYLNSAIGPVNALLGTIYGNAYKKSTGAKNVAAIAFVGEVVGIWFFGWTSDHWSRKWSLVISTIILFVFAALGAGSYGAGGTLSGLIAALTAYRFLLGIGLGGEYPAGSVGCAESTGELESGKRNRWFIWFTNLQIDIGFVVSYIVATIVIYICGENHLRAAWRIILGIGVIPPLSLIWMRFKLDEPEAFQRQKLKNAQYPWLLIFKLYWFRLLIVSAIWFIYDFISFAFGIYSVPITASLVPSDSPTWLTYAWGILINAFYLPGAILGSFVSDKLGPRYTLALGVSLQAIVGYIMAGVYGPISQPSAVAGFCVVYGIFLSLGELGPGDNIGLVASKTCPTAIRGQYYAIAAAFGKIGAFVGTYVFPVIEADGATATQMGQYPFWVASSMALFSAALALFCLPHIGQDTIDAEDLRFRAYLAENGYDTSTMGKHASLSSDDESQLQQQEAEKPAKTG